METSTAGATPGGQGDETGFRLGVRGVFVRLATERALVVDAPGVHEATLGDDDGVHAAARHLEHGETAGDGVEKSGTGKLEDVVAEAELAGVARAEDERLAALLLRASLDGDDGGGAIEGIRDVAEVGLKARVGRGSARIDRGFRAPGDDRFADGPRATG